MVNLIFTSSLLETKLQLALENQIGTGGFSKVFRAIDPQLNAELAIKQIPIAQFPAATRTFFLVSAESYISPRIRI